MLDSVKPLFWVGSSLKDLRQFPVEVRKTVGFALWMAQNGGKHPDAKPLKHLGGGVLEIVEEYVGNAYRAIYTVRFAEAVYVLHAFQKKSKRGIATPPKDINLVRDRLKLAKKHYGKWRTK